jgi:hypothetical protein
MKGAVTARRPNTFQEGSSLFVRQDRQRPLNLRNLRRETSKARRRVKVLDSQRGARSGAGLTRRIQHLGRASGCRASAKPSRAYPGRFRILTAKNTGIGRRPPEGVVSGNTANGSYC